MSHARIAGNPSSQLALPWLPEAAGLLMAAWVTVAVHFPRPFFSPGGIFIWAAACAAVALAANAIVVWGVSYFVPVSAKSDLRSALLRSSAVAVWFPCVFLFSFPANGWLWIPAGLLGMNLTRLAAGYRRPDPGEFWVTSNTSRLGLASLPPRQLSPFLASACLQAAVIAGATGNPRTASVLSALCIGFLLWSFPEAGSRKGSRRAPVISLVLSVAISVLFSLAALMSFIARNGGFSSEYTISNAILRALFGNPAGEARLRVPQPLPDDPDSISQGGGFSGVILVPESKPQAILLAPPPKPIQGFTRLPSHEPLRLPFRGVYWFYKPPHSRPPEHSFSTRGNPVKTSLRSSDQYPLLMAAEQEFSSPVDLACCREIQVGISNADRNPGTVWLELVLTDTRSARKDKRQWIALTAQPVTSSPAPEPGKEPEPAREVLRFTIPARVSIRQFDEITIRYHLSPERTHKSARIEIEDFVFTPR